MDTFIAPGHRALRHGRSSQARRSYVITIVTRGRAPLFSRFDTACTVSRLMNDRTLWRASKAQCWVLMPDHLHALVALADGDSLDALMTRFKSCTSRHVNRVLERRGRIWQREYHDRALRRDEDAIAAARYIVANPLRAGLVERVGDYAFWDAEWLRAGDDTPV